MNHLLRGLGAALAILALAPLAAAQAVSPPATRPAATASTLVPPPAQWHLYAGFGFGAADGKYGDVLQKPLQLDLRIAKQSASGAWRFGVGLQFGSMDPADDPNIPPETAALWLAPDKEWARLETSFSVTRVFNPRGTFRPYLQGRVGIERIHPRSELFYIQPPPENLEPGDSPTRPTNGIGLTVQPGFELALGKTLSLDIAGFATYYKTGSYDMSPLGLPDVDSGFEWGGRVGLAWQPFAASPPEPPKAAPPVDPATGKLRPLPPPDAQRDAWGVRRSWGWATAEVLAIDFGASMFNEYVRNANFNQVSPRSFWANIEEGFTYDDNKFKTNQLVHPFNGSTYFNAARANGIGFWGSSAMALAGAFIWECCGETHPMSYNDMISTGFGGIARGEIAHRISSLILDNTKRGKGRFGQEAAALLFDPIRGFNRAVSGDWSEVKGNPVNPYDWRPTFQLFLRAGGRVIGQGESISENTNKYGFFEAAISYGDPWDPEHHRPYDRFDALTQSNFGDKTRVGRLLIRGDIVSKLVVEEPPARVRAGLRLHRQRGLRVRRPELRAGAPVALRALRQVPAHDPGPGVLHPARGGELEPVVPGRRRRAGADPRVRLRAGRGRLGRALPAAQELPACWSRAIAAATSTCRTARSTTTTRPTSASTRPTASSSSR